MIRVDELQGIRVNPAMFAGFQVAEILEEVDFPLLLRVRGTDGKRWLFNLSEAEHNREEGRRETWAAFQVSPERLTRILDGRVSLRQALAVPEGPVFVLQGADAVHPDVCRQVHPMNLPSGFFPLDDAPASHKVDPFWPAVERDRLLIGVIGIPGHKENGDLPISVSNAVPEALQRYLTWQSARTGTPTGRLFNEAATLDLVAAASGSIRVTCKTSAEKGSNLPAITRSLESLRALLKVAVLNPGSLDPSSLTPEATRAALDLLERIHDSGFSLFLKWKVADGAEQFVALSHHDLACARTALEGGIRRRRETLETSRSWITVRLTHEEMAILQDDTRARVSGGWQNLIDVLKENLDGQSGLLQMTPDQVRRTIHYVQDYGGGGWQDQLRPVYLALHRLGVSFSGFR